MDIFNKKKIKDLETKIKNQKRAIEDYKKEIYEVIGSNKKANEISENLIRENQKLIKWIQNILESFGTMEVRDRNPIQIPICKQIPVRAYDNDNSRELFLREERITIPEITIVKLR